MFKYILYAILAASVIGGGAGLWHLHRVSAKNKKEMAGYAGNKTRYTADLGKTLVIYYSWTGNTQDIAQRIQRQTAADLYEIKTEETFQKGPAFYARVKKQLKTGEYPALQNQPLDLAPYDTVFVGSPVWWYTAATPVLAFLQQTDFQGKRVVPFSTQGSNYGTFFEDFENQAQNARILPGASFNNMDASYSAAVDNKIVSWLNGLPPAR